MTEKLSHRGFRVDFRTEVEALRMRLAHHVMRPAGCVSADASVDEVRRTLAAEALTAIAVVDDEQHRHVTALETRQAGWIRTLQHRDRHPTASAEQRHGGAEPSPTAR